VAAEMEPALVSVIFHGLIDDLSAEALKLSAVFPTAGAQRAQLRGVVRIPETNATHLQAVSELIAARYGAQG